MHLLNGVLRSLSFLPKPGQGCLKENLGVSDRLWLPMHEEPRPSQNQDVPFEALPPHRFYATLEVFFVTFQRSRPIVEVVLEVSTWRKNGMVFRNSFPIIWPLTALALEL